MVSNYHNDIIKKLEQFFAKAPHMSENTKRILVKITPWIALIFGILGVLGGIAGLGALATGAPMAAMVGGMHNYGAGFIATLFWLVYSVLLLVAYPGLKAKKEKGWRLLFWSEAVSVISSVVELQLVSAVIGGIIGFYLLFEIRSYYK